MSRPLTDTEKAARAAEREAARVAALDALVRQQVADWPPIPEDRLRRIALILDPPPLVDTA